MVVPTGGEFEAVEFPIYDRQVASLRQASWDVAKLYQLVGPLNQPDLFLTSGVKTIARSLERQVEDASTAFIKIRDVLEAADRVELVGSFVVSEDGKNNLRMLESVVYVSENPRDVIETNFSIHRAISNSLFDTHKIRQPDFYGLFSSRKKIVYVRQP